MSIIASLAARDSASYAICTAKSRGFLLKVDLAPILVIFKERFLPFRNLSLQSHR
jgi:hypothetical protein